MTDFLSIERFQSRGPRTASCRCVLVAMSRRPPAPEKKFRVERGREFTTNIESVGQKCFDQIRSACRRAKNSLPNCLAAAKLSAPTKPIREDALMQLTGGQALARQLVREGITDVFGIPGVQLDWAVDGLREVSNRIRYVVTRHEQAASYMADGYARTTGRVGACMVVPGPGLLNAMAGLATAYACNSQVLAIVGNIHSPAIGKGYGLLHAVRNQSAILGCVTKWQAQPGKPAEVPALGRGAVKALHSGRPQPVGLEIAPDVLSASADCTLIDPPAHEAEPVRPDPAAIERAAALLAVSRFPVIYAGGGVLAADAMAALQALAERLSAPVVMSENGRGALSDRHPLALNALGGRAVFAHADAVLVVGSRFADTMLGLPSWQAPGIQYVWLNVDPAAWNPPRSAAVGIVGDARPGLEALAAAVPPRQPDRDIDLDKVRAWASEQARVA